jgi:hypothetical protein
MPLTANKLKVTLVLKSEEILTVPAPDGTSRVVLQIKLPDYKLTADVAAKSVRKAQTAVRESGAENVALILQGNLLLSADAIEGAGLSAQPRGPKS